MKGFIGPDDLKSHGYKFEKAYTKDEVEASIGHHRIINYRLGGLNMIIRHETDGYVRPGIGTDNDMFT